MGYLRDTFKSSYRGCVRTGSYLLPSTVLFHGALAMRKGGLALKRASAARRLQQAADFMFYNLRYMRTSFAEVSMESERLLIQVNDPCHYDLLLGIHEREVVLWVRTHAKPGMTFLDIGANIGFYTLLAARAVGDTGTVIAMEPNPDIAALLRRNIEMNSIGNVQVIQGAASRSCGTVRLGRSGASSYSSGLYCKNPQDWIDVSGFSIDSIVAEFKLRPDIIKLDVEGAELETVEGMAQTLSAFRAAVILELHDHTGPADEHPAIRQMKRLGYSAQLISDNHVVCEPARS